MELTKPGSRKTCARTGLPTNVCECYTFGEGEQLPSDYAERMARRYSLHRTPEGRYVRKRPEVR